MKQITYVIGAALLALLSACTTPVPAVSDQTAEPAAENKPLITNRVNLNILNETADLSGYQWLDDDDPAFTEISLQESIRMFSEGGSGIVVYSTDSCPFCNRAIPVLNDVLKEYGIKAYYIDTSQPIASDQKTSMDLYNELCTYIDSIFELDEDGEPMFQIPEVIAVKNGEIVGHHLSLLDSFILTDPEAQLDEAQTEELKEIYRGLIEAAAD